MNSTNIVVNGNFVQRGFGEAFRVVNGEVVIAGVPQGIGIPVAPGTWVAGSGNGGGDLTISFPVFASDQTSVEGYPDNFLRMTWNWYASQGENQPIENFTQYPGNQTFDPYYRFTCLQQNLYGRMHIMGRTVRYSFYCRVAVVGVKVRPMIWVNYKIGDWHIFDLPDIIPTVQWVKYSGAYQLPPIPSGKICDTSKYVGFALDLLCPTSPILDFANFKLWDENEDVITRNVVEEGLLCYGQKNFA